MKKINDSMNSPLRFVDDSGRILGQFYNSRDKKYHLAEYTPYKMSPREYLCSESGNFSPSRREDDRNKCGECWGRLIVLAQKM